jgi:hypothetical protein
MTIMPALWRLRQEDQEFEVTLGYISEFQASLNYTARTYLKNPRARDATQRQSACLVYTRPWVPSLLLQKIERERDERKKA